MANASSPQSTGKTKQRIVGTVVLVALFIIIVLILPSRDDEEIEVLQRVDIPPKPANHTVKVLPIEKPKPPRKPTIPKDFPTDFSVATDQPKPKIEPKPAGQPKAVIDSSKAAGGSSVALTPVLNANQEWVIQVGSFSSTDNANALRDRLKADNYKVFVEKGVSSGVVNYRVLVGPNADRTKLEPFLAKLEKLLGARSIIKSYESK
ncbi:MAG: hypothetical protein COC09_02640 [Gammaproteobacteria bacterium]|nr:SPOR domain-containing protein [Gammaproteobacteria bacterium]PCH64323.1 MAG: hypothetical protein COC09_02640 [Gammaproteobacteria bacterium]